MQVAGQPVLWSYGRHLLNVLSGSHSHLTNVAYLRRDDRQLELDVPLRGEGLVVCLADALLVSEGMQAHDVCFWVFALFVSVVGFAVEASESSLALLPPFLG